MKDSTPDDYAIRIKTIRRRLGVTQIGLAQKIGVSFASINRWENGQAHPNRLAWQKILDAERDQQGTEMESGGAQSQGRLISSGRPFPPSGLSLWFTDHGDVENPVLVGHVIEDFIARRFIRRVLISLPSSAIENWECDLRSLFNLPFRIVSRAEIGTGNPFIGPESDLVIVSVETLSDETTLARLQETQVEPYDLIIFDEEKP